MRSLPDIGLHASALRRLTAGAVFCLAAVVLVSWVERGRVAPSAVAPVAAPAITRSLRLAVESSYPVARWKVQVLGVERSAEASDAWNWQGTVEVPAGEDVVVTAIAAPEATAPHASLRLRLGDRAERIVWGAGDVVVAEPAP